MRNWATSKCSSARYRRFYEPVSYTHLASDLIGEIIQFLLHIGINGVVLSGQNALIIAVGVEETLHRSPVSYTHLLM